LPANTKVTDYNNIQPVDNEISKKQPLFRLMLTFQLRLKSSLERLFFY